MSRRLQSLVSETPHPDINDNSNVQVIHYFASTTRSSTNFKNGSHRTSPFCFAGRPRNLGEIPMIRISRPNDQ